jgi:hypothetical protein
LGCFWEIGGTGRNRTGVQGFADLCLTTRPPRHFARFFDEPDGFSMAFPKNPSLMAKNEGSGPSETNVAQGWNFGVISAI